MNVFEKSIFDEEGGAVLELVEQLNNLLWCPLSSLDASNQHAQCSVDFDSHVLRYQARCGVIREEHGTPPSRSREEGQAGAFARVEGEGLAESGHLRTRRLGLGHSSVVKSCGSAWGRYLSTSCRTSFGTSRSCEVGEEVEASELIEMDDRSSVADDDLSHYP